jgi:colanic acid biosynthesis glycosyl transferase WcaI
MRILLVTQYFWPENFRINDVVEGLVEAGNSVTVLTGVPNYPSGKIMSGYGYLNRNSETFAGAEVKRVPMLTRQSGSGLHLALNYFSFAFSASVLGPWLCRGEFDCIYVYEPSPMTVGFPAIVLKWIKRAPIVFWVQDLWPESLGATGFVKNPVALRLVSSMVKVIYRACDRLLVTSRAFVGPIVALSLQPQKIHYFPQSAEKFYGPRELNKDKRSQLLQGRKFCVTFAGNIGTAQDIPTILECASMLRDHKEIAFTFLGDGSMRGWLAEEVLKRNLDNVVCLGSFPSSDMPDYFSASDALLVSLKNDPLFALTVPAKVQSYLACGRPILASLNGEGAEIIREAGAGLVSEPENPVSMMEKVLELFQIASNDPKRFRQMGDSGLEYSRKYFDRDRLIIDLTNHFSEAKAHFSV